MQMHVSFVIVILALDQSNVKLVKLNEPKHTFMNA